MDLQRQGSYRCRIGGSKRFLRVPTLGLERLIEGVGTFVMKSTITAVEHMGSEEDIDGWCVSEVQ